MVAMDFPQKFVDWVEECISSVMYSVVINRELVDYFPAKASFGNKLF